MAKGKVLFIRTFPTDLNFSTYNMQQIGMGKSFCKLGYDFDFITFNSRTENEVVFYEVGDCKARYIELKRKRLFNWGINLSVCNKSLLDQYDMVICLEYYQIMTVLISNNTDKAVLYAGPYWNMFLLKFVSPIYDFLFTKKLDKQLKVKYAKSELMKEFLVRKGYSNVHDVGVALDTDKFSEDCKISDETNNLISYMKKNRCLLYVGRIDPNKNVSFLLKVFEKVLIDYPDLKLVIIGKNYTPLHMRYKRKQYSDLVFDSTPRNVMDNVLHVNLINNNELRYIYPLAKCLVLPSKLEVFGMVLLEAMYLGAPVLSSRNGGAVTLIPNDNYGQVIDNYNEDLWVKAISRYIDDETYSDLIIKNAHERVVNDFTWDSIVAKMVGIAKEAKLL